MSAATQQDGRFTAAWSHQARLVGLARSRGMSLQDAEDIVSAAILAVATKDDLELDRAGAYLSAVVKNACNKEYRRRARFGELEERADPGRGAEERYCDEAHDAWVIAQVNDLVPAQRDALMARAHGNSVNAVASLMNRTPKATESLLSRARASLRSAAALPAVLVAAGLRRLRSLGAGPVATALAVNAAFVLLITTPWQTWARGPQPAAPPLGRTHQAVEQAGSRTVDRQAHGEAGTSAQASRPSGSQPRTASPAPPAPRHLTPPVAARQGPVGYTDEGTTQRHEDESLAESIQHCLERGPQVGPDFIGCPPD